MGQSRVWPYCRPSKYLMRSTSSLSFRELSPCQTCAPRRLALIIVHPKVDHRIPAAASNQDTPAVAHARPQRLRTAGDLRVAVAGHTAFLAAWCRHGAVTVDATEPSRPSGTRC
jgi:hypothetical protein